MTYVVEPQNEAHTCYLTRTESIDGLTKEFVIQIPLIIYKKFVCMNTELFSVVSTSYCLFPHTSLII